jgi:signal transduction histidine kinase
MSQARDGVQDQPTGETCPSLLSLAVHEFRTPASVVGGYLRMLQRGAADPLNDRQRKMIEEAEKSCARLVEMIGQLSEISKLDGGQLALGRDQIDLFSVAADVADLVHDGEDREVRVTIQGEASGAAALGDAARFRNALAAIVRAIVREKVGPCTVAVDRRRLTTVGKQSAIFVVADMGDVQKAYDAERDGFDEKRGGLGLALPLARRVIEAHGGSVWSPRLAAADSDGRPRGAAVVSIPLE